MEVNGIQAPKLGLPDGSLARLPDRPVPLGLLPDRPVPWPA